MSSMRRLASTSHSTRSLTLVLAACSLAVGCTGGDDGRTGPVSTTTRLVQYATCSALEADLKDMLVADADARIEQQASWDVAEPASGAEDDSGGDSGGSRQEGEDYSGTNNQEEGVDEADFVKTDGYHIYVLNGNRLHIFGVPEFGDLVPESVTEIEGIPRQMSIDRDAGKAVIFSQIYPSELPEEHPLREAVGEPEDQGWWWRVDEITKLTVLDISDRTSPSLVREVFIEGWYQTARMVEGSVRMGTYSWMQLPGLDRIIWGYYDGEQQSESERKQAARDYIAGLELGDLVPRMYERMPDGSFDTVAIGQETCSSFYRPTNSHARGVSSLLSLDLTGDVLDVDADYVVTNWATFYASKDRLYLAEPANDWWWFWWNEDHDEQTNIHVFDTSTPGQTAYKGSGRVLGALHNQFSMGEHDGYLRVATTNNRWNRWWLEDAPPSENHVFVMELDGAVLETVGHVGGLAQGERIFASRFIGDRGYLVTFRNIDPLFTLDLSDPYNPLVVGELKIPGFSTYLHPLSDDHLLAIGVGGDDQGANWRAQISLFDVSEFDAPALQDTHELLVEGDWGWSEAMYEHKAFQYWGPEQLLAVPMATYSYDEGPQGEWSYEYTSKLELVSVDPAAGLASYGAIDHSHFYADPEEPWYDFDVRRSIFMGDYVYVISDRGISSHRLSDLGTVNQEQLPGYAPGSWYWWW